MVCAYHIILSAYGFWLPNDPRGSWSTWVRSWELFRAAGPATQVATRRSVAKRPHDRAARLRAKEALKYPPVIFNGAQARSVGLGFAEAARDGFYLIHACAVLPDHAHLVVARDGRPVEQINSHLKRAASKRLRQDGLHPFGNGPLVNESLHTPWARKGWNVFLDRDDIVRAIRYVEENPLRQGLPRQSWPFVVAFRSNNG
jgi:REP element-mobilizing transposase RayT